MKTSYTIEKRWEEHKRSGGKLSMEAFRDRAERRAKKLNNAVRTGPDWSRKCKVCGQTPVVPETGTCGPCTFGEASTIGGDW